jgi:hypothetical protein
MRHATLTAILLFAAMSGCSGPADAPAPRAVTVGTESLASKSGSTKDPTATWSIPLDDAMLALKSDHRYGDGTASIYADGVCNVGTIIFAVVTSTSPTPSGDATLQATYPQGHSCGRTVVVGYPDGGADTLAPFMNLNKLQSPDPGSIIPVGQSGLRRLIVGFNDKLSGNPSPGRCGRVIFGDNGTAGAGTDMLVVTRLSATTWHVQSQPAPYNRALCENLGAIYDNMNVDFIIVSSYPLAS